MSDRPFGVLAEFGSSEVLISAVRQVRAAGYCRLDAFTPFPIEELERAMHIPRPHISRIGFFGGAAGGAFALLMQLYVNYDYPINVGGRPIYAVTAFAVVTFELTILVSALSMIICMLWQNGLPRLNHPVFAARRFHLATRNRFFLSVSGDDPKFDQTETSSLLRGAGALSVELVPP